MALTDKLTAIANAIREKTGKTESLTLDQMVTEITGIEVGGGGVAITTGTFTLSADSAKRYDVQHGLGAVPKVILCWVSDYETTAGYFTLGAGAYFDGVDVNAPVYAKSASATGNYCYPGAPYAPPITARMDGKTSQDGVFYQANANFFSIGDNNINTSSPLFKLHSGKTYIWVCVG
jgi:hypothetical protein